MQTKHGRQERTGRSSSLDVTTTNNRQEQLDKKEFFKYPKMTDFLAPTDAAWLGTDVRKIRNDIIKKISKKKISKFAVNKILAKYGYKLAQEKSSKSNGQITEKVYRILRADGVTSGILHL